MTESYKGILLAIINVSLWAVFKDSPDTITQTLAWLSLSMSIILVLFAGLEFINE